MIDPLDNIETFEASKDMKCDVCGNNTNHMIFDIHHSNNEEDLCVNCFVNKWGINELVRCYGEQIAFPPKKGTVI